MTPDINLLRDRPMYGLKLSPSKQIKEALRQAAVAVSGAALISAIAYGDWQALEDWVEELKQEFKYPQLPIPPESEGISAASISVIFD